MYSGTARRCLVRMRPLSRERPSGLAVFPPAIVLALAAACDSGRDTAQTLHSQVRDRAGVTIVENARPAPGSRLGWRIGETPAVSIGEEEGDPGEMLFDVRDATRLADGRIVVANAGTSDVRVFAADGTYLETWGRQGDGPGEEWFSSPAGPMAMPHPFGRSTIAAIWSALAVVAPTDRYELRAYQSDGTLVKIIRRDHESRSPTRAELGGELAERYAGVSEARRTSLLAETAEMPLVEFFPAFEAPQSDPLWHLWVQEYRFPGQDRNVWTVFDSDGRVQGFVETPPGLDVFEIGEDYVLGRAMDEFDVERVQLWPLEKG